MKYEVFISSKSADYPYAEKAAEFLVGAGINAFFSKRDLQEKGDADYYEAIDNALEGARHILVVTSSHDNVTGRWVKKEWQTYLNEKLSGRKSGNVVVLLCNGMKVDDLPIGLRQQEARPFQDLPDLLNYFTDEANQEPVKTEEAKSAVDDFKSETAISDKALEAGVEMLVIRFLRSSPTQPVTYAGGVSVRGRILIVLRRLGLQTMRRRIVVLALSVLAVAGMSWGAWKFMAHSKTPLVGKSQKIDLKNNAAGSVLAGKLVHGGDLGAWTKTSDSTGDVVPQGGVLTLSGSEAMLVSKKADYRNVVFTVELAVEKGTEAYIGVRLQPEPQPPSGFPPWVGLTSSIYDNGKSILSGMQWSNFTLDGHGTRPHSSPYGQPFTIKLDMTNLTMWIWVNGEKTSGVGYSSPRFHTDQGCLGIRVVKGSVKVSKLEVATK